MGVSNILASIFFMLLVLNFVSSQSIKVEELDHGLLITEGRDSVLVYIAKGNESHGEHMRSHYVHPLYSLDGQVLIEDYPPDHLHHHGVFWAWHQLYIGDKRIGDGWENKDLEWDVFDLGIIEGKGQLKTIQSKVNWLSPLWLDEMGNKKPVITETAKITIYPSNKNYRLIDFEISLIANQPNTLIGGSEDPKGYGGFSPRIRLPEDIRFIGVEGEVKPMTNPVESLGWLDMEGSLGKNGSQAGMAVLSHPSNPGYPNPWILRSKRSMQNAVYPHPGATPVPLSNQNPTVLKYRLVVHEGLGMSRLSNLHKEYSNTAF